MILYGSYCLSCVLPHANSPTRQVGREYPRAILPPREQSAFVFVCSSATELPRGSHGETTVPGRNPSARSTAWSGFPRSTRTSPDDAAVSENDAATSCLRPH